MSGEPDLQAGSRVVVDSSALVDLAAGDRTVARVLDGLDVCISIITAIEFLAWPKLTEASLPIARSVLDQYAIENIGTSIRDNAAMMRRTFKLKLPDAVIAATAMHLNAPLITRDNDFKPIAHLIEVRLV